MSSKKNNPPTGFSKVQRKFMKASGEWEQYKLKLRLEAAEKAQVQRAKDLLSFEETDVENA